MFSSATSVTPTPTPRAGRSEDKYPPSYDMLFGKQPIIDNVHNNIASNSAAKTVRQRAMQFEKPVMQFEKPVMQFEKPVSRPTPLPRNVTVEVMENASKETFKEGLNLLVAKAKIKNHIKELQKIKRDKDPVVNEFVEYFHQLNFNEPQEKEKIEEFGKYAGIVLDSFRKDRHFDLTKPKEGGDSN